MACLRQLAQREAAEVCEYAMSLAKTAGDKESPGTRKLLNQSVFNISNEYNSLNNIFALKYGQSSYSFKLNKTIIKF